VRHEVKCHARVQAKIWARQPNQESPEGRNGKGPAGPPRPLTGAGGPCRAHPILPGRMGRGSLWSPDQAASGLENFSTASVIRAEIGAKEASASFSAASCSFAVSEKDFSSAARA
jgi:hypothetical protein